MKVFDSVLFYPNRFEKKLLERSPKNRSPFDNQNLQVLHLDHYGPSWLIPCRTSYGLSRLLLSVLRIYFRQRIVLDQSYTQILILVSILHHCSSSLGIISRPLKLFSRFIHSSHPAQEMLSGNLFILYLQFSFPIFNSCVVSFNLRWGHPKSEIQLKNDRRPLALDHSASLPELDQRLIEEIDMSLEDHLSTPTYSSCYGQIFTLWTGSNHQDTLNNSLCSILGHSETQRTAFAARLTICELQTNNLPIPKECTIWLDSASKTSFGNCQACVGALHASPQSWSSFTGNQREAIQLCFSHERLWALEFSNNFVEKTKNLSIELVKSLRLEQHLMRKDLNNLTNQIKISLEQGLQMATQILDQNSENFQTTSKDLEINFANWKENFNDWTTRLRQEFELQQFHLFDKLNQQVARLTHSAQQDMSKAFTHSIQAITLKADEKIHSALESASFRIIENTINKLVEKFDIVFSGMDTIITMQIERFVKIVSQNHQELLNFNLLPQFQTMQEINNKLISMQLTIQTTHKNLENSAIVSKTNYELLKKYSTLLEEKQKINALLTQNVTIALETHEILVRNLSKTLANTFEFGPKVSFQGGLRFLRYLVTSVSRRFPPRHILKFLEWLLWLNWISGGMTWVIGVGLTKLGIIALLFLVKMPLGWLKNKTVISSRKANLRERYEKAMVFINNTDKPISTFKEQSLQRNAWNSRPRRTTHESRIVPKRLLNSKC
ncbi:hypothetical protein O181_000713 [Austropuccinia psidii MF-1]|uniref:Karyogamy protein 5 n=1 Tax=Austropuccinia psidii MF-1 TaxID=1389203 RepID=A0A9Q3B923_9BASI|nr:hypothetical protein [Austropuccinia psidii MF-1]